MSSLSRKGAAWAAGAALVACGCTAGAAAASQGPATPAAAHPGRPAARRVATAGPAAAARPLRLVSVTPAAGGRAVNGTADITVTYNQPPPATAPRPAVSPAVAGSWRRLGDAVVFRPAAGFPAGTRVRVTAAGTTSSFVTRGYATLRLQQLLAQLGYLPLTWTPARGPVRHLVARALAARAPGSAAAVQLSAAYAPPPGTFRWQPGYPAGLRSLWAQGKPNTIDRGAVTAFEADHGLATDGVAGPLVWRALLAAAARHQRNTHGYSYAVASKSYPETLTIWHDGRRVLSSLANTGIAAAPTADGTFPVYEKLPFQVMRGTNPNGTRYADPVSWVSYFNGGDAVHYFPRASYGWPQSLGCVELPYTAAKRAYPYLPYGTLVTVR